MLANALPDLLKNTQLVTLLETLVNNGHFAVDATGDVTTQLDKLLITVNEAGIPAAYYVPTMTEVGMRKAKRLKLSDLLDVVLMEDDFVVMSVEKVGYSINIPTLDFTNVYLLDISVNREFHLNTVNVSLAEIHRNGKTLSDLWLVYCGCTSH